MRQCQHDAKTLLSLPVRRLVALAFWQWHHAVPGTEVPLAFWQWHPAVPGTDSCVLHATSAGVGAYTGNAIASIACGERMAVVDANVVRVLARLRRIAGDPKASAKLHAALADTLLDPDRPGDFNQVQGLALGPQSMLHGWPASDDATLQDYNWQCDL